MLGYFQISAIGKCLKEIFKLNIINLISNIILIKILVKKQIYDYPNFSGSAPKFVVS